MSDLRRRRRSQLIDRSIQCIYQRAKFSQREGSGGFLSNVKQGAKGSSVFLIFFLNRWYRFVLRWRWAGVITCSAWLPPSAVHVWECTPEVLQWAQYTDIITGRWALSKAKKHNWLLRTVVCRGHRCGWQIAHRIPRACTMVRGPIRFSSEKYCGHIVRSTTREINRKTLWQREMSGCWDRESQFWTHELMLLYAFVLSHKQCVLLSIDLSHPTFLSFSQDDGF